MVETIIGIALIVMAIFLVIAVLMQSSKDHRMGASIAGGAETFFGKQKGKTMDALFSKLTTIIAIIFVVLVIVVYFIQPDPRTVTFDFGELEIPTTATSGDLIEPEVIEALNTIAGEGVVITGWSETENGKPVDFNKYKVSKDVTFYALTEVTETADDTTDADKEAGNVDVDVDVDVDAADDTNAGNEIEEQPEE